MVLFFEYVYRHKLSLKFYFLQVFYDSKGFDSYLVSERESLLCHCQWLLAVVSLS